MTLTVEQVKDLIEEERIEHNRAMALEGSLDLSLQLIDVIAWYWLAATGGEYSGDGTGEMAALWRFLAPKGEDVQKFYARRDVSRSMVRELSTWHATDPNVRKQIRSIVNFAEGPRVLDFGGGIGTMAIAMALYAKKRDLDFDIEVIELGPSCREFAAEQAKRLGVRINFVEEPTGEYNTIVGMDVVEHLDRPGSFLDLAHSHLVEDGLLICNWVFYQCEAHPQHIAESTDKSSEFHEKLKELFGPRNKDAVVTENGWPSVHRKTETIEEKTDDATD